MAVLVLVLLAAAVEGAQAKAPWPSRSTPMSSTLGWFRAINTHDRRQLLFYVAPGARDLMRWAQPSLPWSKFTHLHCRQLRTSTQGGAVVYCRFHESPSQTEGNPDSFWDVYLRRSGASWLIDSYGQG